MCLKHDVELKVNNGFLEHQHRGNPVPFLNFFSLYLFKKRKINRGLSRVVEPTSKNPQETYFFS